MSTSGLSTKSRSRRRTMAAVLAAVTISGAAQQAGAELVLLAGGGVLKVDAFQRQGDRMRLVLPTGGALTLSMLRIERIVADEIVADSTVLGWHGRPGLAIPFDDRQRVPDTPFGELIYETSRRHGVNPRLVAAIVQAESAFDPYAISVKGASGLLQLMPATAMRFGLPQDEIFDARGNLEAGVRYIHWLSERFEGDLPLVLAGYNAGEATVERYGGVPPFRETREYILRVYRAAGLSPAEPGSQ